MGLREWIIPQEQVFFDLMAKQSANVVEASKLFVEISMDFKNLKHNRAKMKALEKKGDDFVHETYVRLNETLVTPLEHHDIGSLVSLYDDVLDYMYAVTNRVYLYGVKKPTPAMNEFAKIVERQVMHLNKAIVGIKRIKKHELEKDCVEIHRLENKADELLDEEIAKLFKLKNPVEIMKLKEIYEHMEIITDKGEDVSNVLTDISIKYA